MACIGVKYSFAGGVHQACILLLCGRQCLEQGEVEEGSRIGGPVTGDLQVERPLPLFQLPVPNHHHITTPTLSPKEYPTRSLRKLMSGPSPLTTTERRSHSRFFSVHMSRALLHPMELVSSSRMHTPSYS